VPMSAVTPGSVAASPGAGNPPISLATAVAASKFRSLTTTRAPAAASPRASARPIPEPAPVTTAPAPAISTVTSAGYRARKRPDKAHRLPGGSDAVSTPSLPVRALDLLASEWTNLLSPRWSLLVLPPWPAAALAAAAVLITRRDA